MQDKANRSDGQRIIDQHAEGGSGVPKSYMMSPKSVKAGSRLEKTLRSGHFAVTAEIAPPDSADQSSVVKAAKDLESVCDAMNATDASGAHVHMSSVGVCGVLIRNGNEPVLQVSCRDKNRIAIQGDLLGAHALGVRNVLCLTGDGVETGDHPEAKPVFDLDSIVLLRTARILRDKGQFLSGRKLESPPKFFLGAASNPFVPPYDFRPLRLAKKVEAGADFIQTQYCYDVPRFCAFMKRVRDMGLHKRVFILVGVGPLRSAKGAEWMRKNVPGVCIPEAIVSRMKGVEKSKQKEEGKRICVEIIQQVQEISGVRGVHVMAFRQEEMVGEILEAAGLLPRPWQIEAPAAALDHKYMANEKRFMHHAINTVKEGMQKGQTPFGACVVKDGEIISCSQSNVFHSKDITAHAELIAIRKACEKLNTIDLSGCSIYTTCEPCLMCLSACHWARVSKIVFGARREDATAAGLNDLPVSGRAIENLDHNQIEIIPDFLRDENVELFKRWVT